MAVEASLMLVLVLVGIVVAVLWILLPFAVFGLKDLVREAVTQQRRTNDLLEKAAAARDGAPKG